MSKKENKVTKENNKKLKSKFILILICTLLVVISASFFVFNNFFNNNKYIETNSRKGYILKTVDDSLLKNYLPNKKTMVLFWASWCSYCNNESKFINEFIEKNSEVPVIIVSHDDNRNDIKDYLDTVKPNWFVLFDKSRSIRKHYAPSITTVPYAILLDDSGKLINSHAGEMTYDELVDFYNGKVISE